MRLKIRRLDSTIPLPSYGTDEAAGFDLAAAADMTVAPGHVALVRTGALPGHCRPKQHAAQAWPARAGPRRRTGQPALSCRVAQLPDLGVGIVDPDYSGPNDEIMIQVLNFTGAAVHITRGDRLAQGVVLPAPRVAWQEVDEIRPATRGGFGATGD